LGLQRTGAAVDILAVNLDRRVRTAINALRDHPAIGGAALAIVVMLVLGFVTRGGPPASYQAVPMVEATSPATSLAPVEGAGTEGAAAGDPATSTRPTTTTTTRPATTTTAPRPATTTTVRVHSAPATTPTTRPATTTTSTTTTTPTAETDPVDATTTTTAAGDDSTDPEGTHEPGDGETDPEATTTTGPPPKLAIPGTPCHELDDAAVDDAGTPLSCRPGVTEPWFIWQ
jgi:hypothetical protein